ncbi:MAG: nitroreductase family protein [Actinobacteria bacterium]|nr:nitroreductase family protein [Actinomycetota bacterium]
MSDQSNDIREVMRTCIAMRHLKTDEVPEQMIIDVVRAATYASNPGNSQNWRFVVVRDRDRKERLASHVRATMGARFSGEPTGDESRDKMMAGARRLVEGFADVPVWIFVIGLNAYPPQAPNESFVWSTVYPASQNLVLAARALGLGTTFTTFHLVAPDAFRAELGVPNDAHIGTSIALGFPEKKFTSVNRKAVSEVIRWERFS